MDVPSAMEFWGIEVKPGKTVSCDAGDHHLIHISQVALGETKNKKENVVVYIDVDGEKIVIGHLSTETHSQFMCDLVIEKEFELSHSSKTSSVFLCGYKVPKPNEDDSSEEDEEEENKIHNGVGKHLEKPTAENGKKDKKVEDSDDSEDLDSTKSDDDDDDLSEDDSTSDDGSNESPTSQESSSSMESSDDEDESDEENEETPKKQPEISKKRAAGPALNTPASGKKSKIATPSVQKTGDKKSTHVATPHPAKAVGKTPAISKPNEKTPQSPTTHTCKSCSKKFGSDAALQSHQKAKHQTNK